LIKESLFLKNRTNKMRLIILFFIVSINLLSVNAQQKRARDWGIHIGVLAPGTLNAITDVPGVKVGHTTINRGDSVHTGVTAILPHSDNIFQHKVPAGIFVGNGFGKLVGTTQVMELGTLESPVILTNTLSVSTAMSAVVDYTLQQKGNEKVFSVNAVVGETNDSYLNDIRGRHVKETDVLNAINQAKTGTVEEGSVGAGTGTVCFQYKGGIGTASRKLPAALGGYTVGVLVQTNFGGVLQIDGVPVGAELQKYYLSDQLTKKEDGSCMIVVATDAPLDSRNLERLAKRAFMGLAKTGGIAHNGSGDYVIAFSTDSLLRVEHSAKEKKQTLSLLLNDAVSPLFMAAIEATEEAIINSLFAATTTRGISGHTVEALPLKKLIDILQKYNRIKN
jgi:D-aminopeptidase